jgi:Ran GTPase-activating protein (RanGAP) involved in mRNA processing and transport
MSMKIEIEGDSRQAVALALLNMIARAEGKLDEDGGMEDVGRAWLLDTYAECLVAASGEREVEPRDEDDEEDDEGDDEEDEDEDEEEDSKAA